MYGAGIRCTIKHDIINTVQNRACRFSLWVGILLQTMQYVLIWDGKIIFQGKSWKLLDYGLDWKQ